MNQITLKFIQFKEIKKQYKLIVDLIKDLQDLTFLKFLWLAVITNKWNVMIEKGRLLLPRSIMIFSKKNTHIILEHCFIYDYGDSNIVKDFKYDLEKYLLKTKIENTHYLITQIDPNNKESLDFFINKLGFEEERISSFKSELSPFKHKKVLIKLIE